VHLGRAIFRGICAGPLSSILAMQCEWSELPMNACTRLLRALRIVRPRLAYAATSALAHRCKKCGLSPNKYAWTRMCFNNTAIYFIIMPDLRFCADLIRQYICGTILSSSVDPKSECSLGIQIKVRFFQSKLISR